jgi:hypothetical protein
MIPLTNTTQGAETLRHNTLSFAKFLQLGVCFLGLTVTGYTQIYLHKQDLALAPSTLTELKSPQAVEIDIRGFIYVADGEASRIFKFSPNLQLLAKTSGWGNERDLLDHPIDIAVDNGLNLLVAEYFSGRIIRLDCDLNYISEAYPNISGNDFKYPISIALSNWGEVFILGENTGEVLKMTSLSDKASQFGGFRPGKANLSGAKRLAPDDNGRLYFSLPEEKSLSVYDRYGSYLQTIRLNFSIVSIDADGNSLFLASEDSLYRCSDSKIIPMVFSNSTKPVSIEDIAVANGVMALLSATTPYIYIYRVSLSP